MKIAFFGESPADQAALKVFTEGILGELLELPDLDLQGHGVTGVLSALFGVFRGVYYNSDAEGLVVVVDSDDTELHSAEHDKSSKGGEDCRLCEVRRIIAQAKKHLRPRPGRRELQVAVGVAIPAIEAWYLVGKEHEVGEAAWRVGMEANRPPFTRPKLKKLVYGTDRPSLEIEIECATREAQRIINNINAIEAAFPIGFGLMACEIRSWKSK